MRKKLLRQRSPVTHDSLGFSWSLSSHGWQRSRRRERFTRLLYESAVAVRVGLDDALEELRVAALSGCAEWRRSVSGRAPRVRAERHQQPTRGSIAGPRGSHKSRRAVRPQLVDIGTQLRQQLHQAVVALPECHMERRQAEHTACELDHLVDPSAGDGLLLQRRAQFGLVRIRRRYQKLIEEFRDAGRAARARRAASARRPARRRSHARLPGVLRTASGSSVLVRPDGARTAQRQPQIRKRSILQSWHGGSGSDTKYG
jgi:hypothetical protein|eukprot:COSAG06_NODE_2433_length_6885_cov_2.054966_6_plen_258_part_00